MGLMRLADGEAPALPCTLPPPVSAPRVGAACAANRPRRAAAAALALGSAKARGPDRSELPAPESGAPEGGGGACEDLWGVREGVEGREESPRAETEWLRSSASAIETDWLRSSASAIAFACTLIASAARRWSSFKRASASRVAGELEGEPSVLAGPDQVDAGGPGCFGSFEGVSWKAEEEEEESGPGCWSGLKLEGKEADGDAGCRLNSPNPVCTFCSKLLTLTVAPSFPPASPPL